MGLQTIASNAFKYEKGLKKVDFVSDVFKLILLKPDFVFDPAAHGFYAGEVLAAEISGAAGYPVGGYLLTTQSVWTRNDTDNVAEIGWEILQVTASAATTMDDFRSAIIYSNSHPDLVVLGHILCARTIRLADTASYYFIGLKHRTT